MTRTESEVPCTNINAAIGSKAGFFGLGDIGRSPDTRNTGGHSVTGAQVSDSLPSDGRASVEMIPLGALLDQYGHADLAKIDAGQMEIHPVPTDVVALLRSLLTAFEVAARQKGVQLELRAPAGLHPLVIDPSWIDSAITNLVANALRLPTSEKSNEPSLTTQVSKRLNTKPCASERRWLTRES